MLGAPVHLAENLQRLGSFKIRGATYRLTAERRRAPGVVAASAGNHAQGVALVAQKLGISATIFCAARARAEASRRVATAPR
ncbi:MAG: pyridoxal-phosphate dependent enzyme [Microbacterium sp.]